MRLRCPAKINLWLKILRRRPDGYHELQTLMLPLALADEMRFAPARNIVLECDHADVPKDENNLAVRAAHALKERFGVRRGAKIFLHKRIPVGGGLGGGSSNAATTLVALNRLWNLGATDAELRQIAVALGSDVAFFLDPRPSLCLGRGEIVTPAANAAKWERCWFLLANPGFGVSTKWAYEHYDARPIPTPKSPIRNSLEPTVFAKFPILALLKSALRRHGARAATMSGSGATVFGIVRSRAEGQRIARKLQEEFGPTLWRCVTRMMRGRRE